MKKKTAKPPFDPEKVSTLEGVLLVHAAIARQECLCLQEEYLPACLPARLIKNENVELKHTRIYPYVKEKFKLFVGLAERS